jgi:cell division septum initiation protein DivIVA
MALRAASDGASGEGRTAGASAVSAPAHPNVRGDLEELMDHRPVFRTRLQGYDRLEVDNYTAWAEGELVAVRREVDHLLSRFAQCSAELEISRRLLAEAPRGRETFPVSERVQKMLALAADEAAAIAEAGTQEADRLIAEARTEADARLRKAHEIKEQAVAAADELVEQARRDRAEAAVEVERAHDEAAGIVREAVAERDRLMAQAAQEAEQVAAAAAAHRAAVQADVDALSRRAERAREFLRTLTERIGEALQVAAATVPGERDEPNVAAEGMHRDDGDEPNVAAEGMHRDEPNVAAMAGPPTPIAH